MQDLQAKTRVLARIVRPQGRVGEVLCELHTDFPEQFTQSSNLTLCMTDQRHQPAAVEHYWKPLGRNAGRIVLKLQGVDSITTAETLRGASIHTPDAERVEVESSRYFVADLIGCDFFDGDTCLGKVADIQFPASSTGKQLLDAAALFVVSTADEADLLIPFANQFTKSINLEHRSIHMELPNGLVQLNGS